VQGSTPVTAQQNRLLPTVLQKFWGCAQHWLLSVHASSTKTQHPSGEQFCPLGQQLPSQETKSQVKAHVPDVQVAVALGGALGQVLQGTPPVPHA
jgi:hypothetical protein